MTVLEYKNTEHNRAYMRSSVLLFVIIAALFNISVWYKYREKQAEWMNVPPVPSKSGAVSLALGDTQLAYRSLGLILLNIGDTGGRSTSLEKYNYEALADWFYLLDDIDERSSFAPFMASFYYGAVKDGSLLRPLIMYLAEVGRSQVQKEGRVKQWRWLAHAVYLARYKLKDLDLAVKLANELAAMDDKDMPAWTKQLPAFVYHAQGKNEEAIAIMTEILKAGGDNIDPAEFYFTREYICTRLMSDQEARTKDVCKDFLVE